MKILLKLFCIGLQILYLPLKLFPVKKNRILFLSRQSNETTLDFQMIQSALKEHRPNFEFVTICKRSSDSKNDLPSFAAATIKSMYFLATSSVCILDSYWPAACILKHKKSLKIIQIWHALGKIKQSGYQTLGKAGGRGRTVAECLSMHRQYDYIIAGGAAWNPFYCASFDTTPDKLLNYGLPRIDYLLSAKEDNRKKIFDAYPMFQEKELILYAPTFRKGIELNWTSLLESINFEKYNLIVKGHPNQPLTCSNPNVYTCEEFRAVDLLAAADYLITDYSAIAIEGAILNCKTYYFVYDYDEYTSLNGTNINLFDEMPGCVFRTAKELGEALDKPYPTDSLNRYQQRFLPAELGTATQKIASLIQKLAGC